jgi:hypothetical protein
MTDINIILGRALEKRDRIIAREGDDSGERRKPQYLKALVEEEIKADVMRDRCLESLSDTPERHRACFSAKCD